MKKIKARNQFGRAFINESFVSFEYNNLCNLLYVSGDIGKGAIPIAESQVVTLEFEDGSTIMADINLDRRKNAADVTLLNQNGIEFARTRFGLDNQEGALFDFAIWLSEKGHTFVLEEKKRLYKYHKESDANDFSFKQTLFDYNGNKLAGRDFTALTYAERNKQARASREKLLNKTFEQER